MSESPDRQRLHIVLGGELKSVNSMEFRDLSQVEFVGAYGTHEEAVKAWRTKAQQTVDNAHARYFIVHAHKLLDPDDDGVPG